MGDWMIDGAIAIVVVVFGTGSAGVAIAWLNDRRHVARARRTPTPDPRQILETRFAKGEIDELDFNRRMHALTYGPPLELGRSD